MRRLAEQRLGAGELTLRGRPTAGAGAQITIRPLVTADGAALEELARRELPREPYADAIPAIVTRFPHVGLVAEADGRICGCCVGSRSRHGDTGEAHLDLILVAGAHRRRGIGRGLLEHLEAEFVREGYTRLRAEGNPPCYAWPGVDADYTSGLRCLERLGFVRGSRALSMDVDLTADIFDTSGQRANLERGGITFRRGTKSDEATVARLAPEWPASWIQQLTLALGNAEGGVHFAEQGAGCVGFCAAGVNRAHEIGPLGTEAGVRRRGIGAVLLKLCCQDQRALGLDRAEVQWAGPLGYFSEVLQARAGRVFWLYRKDL
jgi:ribosomal protein S18 acetylase RimI-like enzyme